MVRIGANLPANVMYAIVLVISGCENGDIRLYGGTDPSNGRVEFCKDRRWIAVCSDGWGLDEARVMCGLLDFGQEGIYIIIMNTL